mmetsp:Transcript_28477/g.83241  ORF Transcript_28477/g.83241 Transcript_28477/m.83241 type:complete len:263 (-) Transcript_28477:442-1230(-)
MASGSSAGPGKAGKAWPRRRRWRMLGGAYPMASRLPRPGRRRPWWPSPRTVLCSSVAVETTAAFTLTPGSSLSQPTEACSSSGRRWQCRRPRAGATLRSPSTAACISLAAQHQGWPSMMYGDMTQFGAGSQSRSLKTVRDWPAAGDTAPWSSLATCTSLGETTEATLLVGIGALTWRQLKKNLKRLGTWETMSLRPPSNGRPLHPGASPPTLALATLPWQSGQGYSSMEVGTTFVADLNRVFMSSTLPLAFGINSSTKAPPP